jgi:hypothetical protein
MSHRDVPIEPALPPDLDPFGHKIISKPLAPTQILAVTGLLETALSSPLSLKA